MWLTPTTWLIIIGCKILHFINNKDQEAFGYKTLRRTNVVVAYRVFEF